MSYLDQTLSVPTGQRRVLRGGTGQPLLYLHDTFTYTWTAVHERLAEHYEVIVPLHPGCDGLTDLEDIDTLDDLLLRTLDVCTALDLLQPIVLGTSLGGWLAAEWAMRYPGMLGAVVLVDALGLRLPEAPAADIWCLDPAQTRAILFADPQAAIAQELVPDVPTPDVLSGLLQARQTLARFAWQFPDNPRLRRYLYRVNTPTLIVWGAQDGLVSSAHGQAYQQGIADAELSILPDCGHLPHMEQTEAFVETVLDYLDRQGW